MEQRKLTVEELVDGLIGHLEVTGYKESTRERYRAYYKVSRFHSYRVSAAQTIPGVGERSRSGCSAVLRLTSPSRAAAFSSWPRPKTPRARR